MKKIGILTHPLIDNYGGILQCVALYHFLQQNNYEVFLLQKHRNYPLYKKILISLLERIPFQNIRNYHLRHKKEILNKEFINQYIPNKSPIFTKSNELSDFIDENNDVYAMVVGSDQVWRYNYINDGYYASYFLDFITSKSKIKKISYAASFGTEKWEKPEVAPKVSSYLSQFSFVSVREKSGLNICKEEFGVENAFHVCDPTLLHDEDFYINIARDSDLMLPEEYMLSYILDDSDEKDFVISSIKNKLAPKAVQINISKMAKNGHILTIPDWLKTFINANLVVTDSFHGVMFSIILGKDFYFIPNKKRGRARFDSLLAQFDIQDRMIIDSTDIDRAVKSLDKKRVIEFREYSKRLLLNALEK